MFEESLVESTRLLQTRSHWPAIVSVGAQAVAAALILAVPLFHPELLPMQARSFALTPPPPPRPQPIPPPARPVHVTLASAAALPHLPFLPRSFVHRLLTPSASTADTPVSSFVGTTMGGNSTSALRTLNAGTSPIVTAAPAPSPTSSHPGRLTLSSGVTAGLLLDPIRPEYPSIAKAAGLQGSVVVRAVISRDGHIERAQVISGPAMLQNAALQAVERARYRPYLLNGQPTEVETTVTIHFHLGDG